MRVLVGIHVGDTEPGTLQCLNLRDRLVPEFVRVNLAGKSRRQEVIKGGTKRSAVRPEQRRDQLR